MKSYCKVIWRIQARCLSMLSPIHATLHISLNDCKQGTEYNIWCMWTIPCKTCHICTANTIPWYGVTLFGCRTNVLTLFTLSFVMNVMDVTVCIELFFPLYLCGLSERSHDITGALCREQSALITDPKIYAIKKYSIENNSKVVTSLAPQKSMPFLLIWEPCSLIYKVDTENSFTALSAGYMHLFY